MYKLKMAAKEVWRKGKHILWHASSHCLYCWDAETQHISVNLFTGLTSSNTLQGFHYRTIIPIYVSKPVQKRRNHQVPIHRCNFFGLLFTAQPGTPIKSADCFHCNITGKKLLCLKLYATCLAQHQNETWMNGLTKSLKDSSSFLSSTTQRSCSPQQKRL